MILVTGATGFVGQRLVQLLRQQGCPVRPAARVPQADHHAVGDINGQTDWGDVLDDVEVVVHLAGRVHVMDDGTGTSEAAYFEVNVDGTLNLAKQAAAAGVRRFIYLSSIKVNGEETSQGAPFRAADAPHPSDAYGRSKLAAETGLLELSRKMQMEVVIIRPPLVYGPGVKANFQALLRIVAAGVPLPLAGVENRRSLVFIDNLCDLIHTCVTHPDAAGQVFLVSDDEDVSTADLARKLAKGLGKNVMLFPVPQAFLKKVARLLGKEQAIHRLLSSLQVDVSHTKARLDWKPPVDLEKGLSVTAAYFRNGKR